MTERLSREETEDEMSWNLVDRCRDGANGERERKISVPVLMQRSCLTENQWLPALLAIPSSSAFKGKVLKVFSTALQNYSRIVHLSHKFDQSFGSRL